MSLAYLLDPVNQYQNRAGVNNVSGFFKVFRADTDDIATTYKDFNGALNPERIPIDNNGRAVIIAESGRPYRVEMYLPSGSLEFTQYPVYPMASGGSGLVSVNIESTDGSIDVDKTVVGGATNFDLGMAADDSQFLDWIKCVGATAAGEGVLIPQKSEGTMHMSASGIILRAGQLYHITARFSATKTSTEPFYDNVTLAFRTYDGETDSVVHQENRIIDYSLGLVQEFEVSADIKIGDANTSLRFAYGAQDVHGGEIRLVGADVHRIFSGISRAAGSLVQEQADWTEANPAAPSYIKNKPQNLVQDASYVHTDNNFTTAEKDKLSGIETGADVNVQANWTEANTSSDAYIQNKPDIRNVPDVTANDDGKVLQASYSGGTGSYSWQAAPPEVFTAVYGTTTYSEIEAAVTAGKLVNVVVVSGNNTSQGILKGLHYTGTSNARAIFVCPAVTFASGAISGVVYTCQTPGTWSTTSYNQVQADWAQTTTWDLGYIKNKPNLATVATSGSYNDLSNKPSIPAAQVPSDWNEADSAAVDYIKNKPNLAAVATSGSYSDLSNKPSIPDPQVQADWTEADNSKADFIKNKPNLATVATSGSYEDLSDKPSIPAPQVQADWTEADNTQADYIKNKPNLATVATSGSYDDLSNKPSIPAAQVNSDWNASSGIAEILNKPNLATVATSGSYNDLSNKPTIPAAQVNSDWNASSGVSAILNKPSLATVATSGSYNDLSNKPTIPAAQVNSDWNAVSGVAQIKNKPTLATVATSGSYNDLSNKPTIPAAANNGVLTITQNGTSKGTFSANQSGNSTIALTDTTYSQISRGSGAGLAPGLPSGSGTSKYLREDGTWQTPDVSSVDINEGSPASQTVIELMPRGGYVLSVGSKDIGFDTWAGKPSHAAELYVHHTWGTGKIPVYHVRNIKNGYINYVPVENVSGSCTVTIEAPYLSLFNEQYDYVVAFTSYANSTLAGSVDVEDCQPSGHYENGVFVVDYPSLHGYNPPSSPVIFVTGPVYTYLEARRT